MEWLQDMLDSSTTPVFTAFLLGLLTALSPCPLATNIAAVGYISKEVHSRRGIFLRGVLYTLGRTFGYTLLGVLLIALIRKGINVFDVQRLVGLWGDYLLGPSLVLMGLFMLFGHRLVLPQFGLDSQAEGMRRKGGRGAFLLGMLFAMAFCPSSGMFYFGMLIPLSATFQAGYLLPIVFALATALPVLVVAWTLAFSMNEITRFYGRMKVLEWWISLFAGILFIAIGLYKCYIIYL